MKLNEITEKGNYTIPLMVTEVVQKEAKNGNPFLDVKLSDGEKEIVAKYFSKSASEFVKRGTLLDVKLTVQEYNGSPNYKIESHSVNNTDDKSDFIMMSPMKPEVMYKEIIKTAKSFKNESLKKLVISIYEDNKEKLLYWSAAKSMHHNIYGGLLYHSYRMMLSAIELSKIYNVSSEMVIAGCILHDIGKLSEMNTDELGIAEYTIDGNLFGHLFIGAEIVKNYCKKLSTDAETTRQIMHIICSHHENLEWGAIAKPATTEAFLVSQIDYFDSQIYVYEKATSELEPGSIAETRIMNGTYVYNPKK